MNLENVISSQGWDRVMTDAGLPPVEEPNVEVFVVTCQVRHIAPEIAIRSGSRRIQFELSYVI